MNITKKAKRDLQILMRRGRRVHEHRDYWRTTHPIISMTGNGKVSFHVSQDDAHFYHANYRSLISVREWAERVQRQALNIKCDYGKFANLYQQNPSPASGINGLKADFVIVDDKYENP